MKSLLLTAWLIASIDRPTDKYYMCPSNTFIASNGDVYEIEPFMLPPPTEIAALFKELKYRRDRSDSHSIESDPRSSMSKYSPVRNRDHDDTDRKATMSHATFLSQLNRQRISSFDSTTADTQCGAGMRERENLMRSPSKRSSGKTSHVAIFHDDGVNERGSESDNGSNRSRSNSTVQQMINRQHRVIANHEQPRKSESKPESSIGAYPTFLHTDQLGPKNRDEEEFDWENFSFQKYLLTEMFGIGESGHLQPAAVGHMQNFLTVPSKVEAFIGFGFFICLDAFLNVVAFLPLRVLYSAILLLCETSGYIIRIFLSIFFLGGVENMKRLGVHLKGHFQRCHLYDLMRGTFILLSCFVLLKLNMSRVYHYIRGQTLIKLYVLTAMLEIFDKLLCSFGQDAFDSLYCITRMRPEVKSLFISFIVTAVYCILHSGLYFLSIATLTVAINSADQALVTVLVLNNFGEIKSFVFKKFDNKNLFQLSCSDVTERFQLVSAAQYQIAWHHLHHIYHLMLRIESTASHRLTTSSTQWCGSDGPVVKWNGTSRLLPTLQSPSH